MKEKVYIEKKKIKEVLRDVGIERNAQDILNEAMDEDVSILEKHENPRAGYARKRKREEFKRDP